MSTLIRTLLEDWLKEAAGAATPTAFAPPELLNKKMSAMQCPKRKEAPREGLEPSTNRFIKPQRRLHLVLNSIGTLQSPLYVPIQLLLMIPVIGQSRVDLPKDQVRMLKVQLFWTPATGHFLQNEFDHFGRGALNDRDARFVKNNVFVLYLL